MLPENDGPLAYHRPRPGDLAFSRRLVLAEGLQGSVGGPVGSGLACSPRMTGAAGRCLLRIPSGIGAVRGGARCSRASVGAGKPDEQEPQGAAAGREALAG